MSMIEKAAKAVQTENSDLDLSIMTLDEARIIARACIAAIREPDEGMLWRAWDRAPREIKGMADLIAVHQAMIDRILEGE